MATKTIGQLTQATTINNADEFAIEQSGVTKRVAASVVRGDIINANIKSDAAIALSKLATGALPSAITVASANLVDAAITAPKLSGAQTGSAPIYGCRAWVNFNGGRDSDGNLSTSNTNRQLRASGNVSSVLRNGEGNYTVTFTTAMADANYAVCATVSRGTASSGTNVVLAELDITSRSASSFTLRTNYADPLATGAFDAASVEIIVFR